MPGSQSEPGSGGESDSVPSKSSSKRLKNRNKVWDRVPWFKKRNPTSDNVGATASGSKAANNYISSQAVQGASVDSADLDYSPETSSSSFSPARSCSLFGSTSSGDLDAFDGCQAESDDTKRSKLYPNSEVIEQNCLRPSIARALFLQLDSWLSKKDGTDHSRHKYTWPKKKHSYTVDPSDDVASGITRTVSMPGGMMRRSKCHCAACCSCTYRDKLEGMCSVCAKLNTSTTSLDTGLVMMGFSSQYNPLIRADSEPIDVAESAHRSNPNANLAKMSPSATVKCNSLPSPGSMLAYKTCNMCGKLISTNIPTKPTCSDSSESNLPSISGSSAQMVLPELAFCHCNQKPNVNKPNKTTLPCQAHGVTAICHNTTDVRVNTRNVLYQPKVGPSEFKERVDLIRQWFSEFSDEQKNLVLKQLLNDCDLPQLHLLSVEMEPKLHANCPPNCHDRLSWLPQSLSLHIFSYLDPVSLCQASAVCHRWYQLTNDSSLWKHFCGQSKWRLSRAGESKQLLHHMTPDGIIQWKKVFADRYRLRNNWLRGRCNVRTFEGHTQGISCVQFDDTRIVSGSSDKTIKVWNIRTNNPWAVQTLVGHSGTVRCLHLDGNRLVSGSTDRTIKVWDLSTQQSWSSIACKVTMVGHTDTVRCLQVDEDKVISGSYDKTLKVWDIKTGQCRMTLRGHSAAVLCVQFDNTKIVSGSCDKTIKVWAFDGECMMTLQGHHDAVTCLQFDTTRIFSGSLDCNLKFWDINTGCCINTIDWKASEGHTGVVRCLQADSWRVVSASDDRTLKVWSLETGQRLVTLRNHTDGVTCLQFNDSIIVSGSYDKTVKLWDFSCC